jgi:protein-S-isoprenylcysteine O-methyltransferase Ste14
MSADKENANYLMHRPIPAQAATLAGVFVGVALALYLRLEPGPAMVVALLGILSAWILAEGLPVALDRWKRRPERHETPALFWYRVATKLVGLCALVGIAVIACSAFPFFAQSAAVRWFLAAGYATLVPLLVLAVATILYVAATDLISDDADDYLHQIGRAVLMQDFREADALFAMRVVTIKCFFLVLMFSGGMASLAWLANNPFWTLPLFSAAWFDGAVRLVYLVDVILAAGGYIATFKLFGWHVRATETTALGWLVCLACYEPFFPAISRAFVPYGEGPGWGAMMQDGSAAFIVWSIVVLIFHVIYVWATVAFGPRFSNLTNRGIITTGPYRFVKHPAYLAKNTAWWISSIPGFIASGFGDGLIRAGMLAIISFIYFQRARAEERMLCADPAYRIYVNELASRGLWPRAKRLFKAKPAA